MIPDGAVEAAAKAYRSEFPYDENEGYIIKLILEAAAPYMLAGELAAEYRRGYRDGLTDRKQVTAEPRAWEPGDPIE